MNTQHQNDTLNGRFTVIFFTCNISFLMYKQGLTLLHLLKVLNFYTSAFIALATSKWVSLWSSCVFTSSLQKGRHVNPSKDHIQVPTLGPDAWMNTLSHFNEVHRFPHICHTSELSLYMTEHVKKNTTLYFTTKHTYSTLT